MDQPARRVAYGSLNSECRCLTLVDTFRFAVAQPMFSLLSGYAEFFVARQSQPLDLILLSVILCLGLPSLLILLDGIARMVGSRASEWIHASLIAVLTATILLQVIKRLTGGPGVWLLVAAVILGVIGSVAYVRAAPVRTYLTFLSPAILLFPAMFFLNSGIYKIVLPEQVAVQLDIVDATAPVVMVVFDEFPLASLLDEDRAIDPIRFPNIARLAAESYWFRNATSVSDSTLMSIPATLSGLSPQLDDPRIPTNADYPNTLFTLLGGSYRLEVVENGTKISPSIQVRQGLRQRMKSLLSDLTIVYAHMLLPSDLTSGFPAVDRSWNNFESGRPEPGQPDSTGPQSLRDFVHDTDDRAGKFYAFINSIRFDRGPALFFLHSMLPHMPWQYLPDGTLYSLVQPSPGMPPADSGYGTYPKWVDDESTVTRAYRRHLLQVAFVDTLIGQLIDKLESIDVFDRSLIVITADHGMSFRPDDFVRRATETNVPDIMWVPMLIKAPHQDTGVVIDRNIETIDILPTVADALGIEVPWETDGRSALDDTSEERPTKTMLAGRTQEFVLDGRSTASDEGFRRKLELFGSGSWDPLFAHGTYADLVGREVQEFGLGEAGIGVELDGEAFFDSVTIDSTFLLANITGRISAGQNELSSRHLAVAVNGRIGTVTELPEADEGIGEFTALVPATAFRPGRNEVEVFFVVEDDGKPRLEHLPKESRPYFGLTDSTANRGAMLQTSGGESVPIIDDELLGYARTATDEESDTVSIIGWALDASAPDAATTILVFQNQQLVYSGTPDTERPDVANAYPQWVLSTPGFNFELPLAKFDDSEVRVFALSETGTASELRYIRENWIFAFSPP